MQHLTQVVAPGFFSFRPLEIQGFSSFLPPFNILFSDVSKTQNDDVDTVGFHFSVTVQLVLVPVNPFLVHW